MKTAIETIRDINRCKSIISKIKEEENVINNNLYLLEIEMHDRLELLHKRKLQMFAKLALLGAELHEELQFFIK